MKDLMIEGVTTLDSKHPLDRPVRTISCWEEWLRTWEAAETIEEFLSLLHWGFSKHITNRISGTYEERLIFYFRVANGWTSPLNMRREEREELVFSDPHKTEKDSQRSVTTRQDARVIIAGKAASVIHKVFFSQSFPILEQCDDYLGEWKKYVSPTLLQTIIAFFGVCEGSYDGHDVSNLPGKGSPQHKNVKSFLVGLAHYIWMWRPEKVNSWDSPECATIIAAQNQLMQTIHLELRRWIIHMLCEVGEFDLLHRKITSDCVEEIEVLKKRALARRIRSNWEFGEDQFPTTIAEAIVAGSREARFLTCLTAYEAGLNSITKREKKEM